jgi:hypothetical protein
LQVIRVVLQWISEHWCDFAGDQATYQKLVDGLLPEVLASGYTISHRMLKAGMV